MATWTLGIVALFLLWSRRPKPVLDLWLIVVVWAWMLDVALSAYLARSRFDLGFYSGRVFGLVAASSVLGALLVNVNRIYGRQAAIASRLATSEERLRLAVEASRMGMWDRDMRTEETTWNDEYYHLLGYGVGEVKPGYATWIGRVHPDDRAATEEQVTSAMRERGIYVSEYRALRPDGAVRRCVARGRFFYDHAGKPIRMIGLVEDITEVRQQAEQQRVLVAELQHRTRNLMAVVHSIVQQTMETAESLEDFEHRFNQRLMALSRVQRLLSRADHEAITIGGLVGMELDALGSAERGDKVKLAGPKVLLRKSAVQMLSLAIHELATNALKYGAPEKKDGSLSVTWRIERTAPDGHVLLEWIERGIAPAPRAADNARRGYGRTLIEEALPYSLSAQTTFELGRDSLRCIISLPFTTRDGKEMAG